MSHSLRVRGRFRLKAKSFIEACAGSGWLLPDKEKQTGAKLNVGTTHIGRNVAFVNILWPRKTCPVAIQTMLKEMQLQELTLKHHRVAKPIASQLKVPWIRI